MTRPAQSMPDPDAPPSVLVKTFLRPYTYRQLTGHAAQRGLTLSELLSLLADASLRPVDGLPARRRRNTRRVADYDAEIRAMNADGMNDSQIGRALGFTPTTIRSRRDAMGLPKRAAQGRKKKEAVS